MDHPSSPNDISKKHQLSLVLVGLFFLATNGSLILMPNGRLSLVTVGREDRRRPMTTYVFLQYHLGHCDRTKAFPILRRLGQKVSEPHETTTTLYRMHRTSLAMGTMIVLGQVGHLQVI